MFEDNLNSPIVDDVSVPHARTTPSSPIQPSLMTLHSPLLLTATDTQNALQVSSYPPLVNMPSSKNGKIYVLGCLLLTYRELMYMEWLLSCVGSVMFVVGSYLFFPDLDCGEINCELPGAMLFLVGSTFFFIASFLLFVRSDAASWSDYGLSVNATLYLAANFLFVIGSFLFIPVIVDDVEDHKSTSGVVLFIIGSVIFVFAPLYDFKRALELRSKGQLSNLRYHRHELLSLRPSL